METVHAKEESKRLRAQLTELRDKLNDLEARVRSWPWNDLDLNLTCTATIALSVCISSRPIVVVVLYFFNKTLTSGKQHAWTYGIRKYNGGLKLKNKRIKIDKISYTELSVNNCSRVECAANSRAGAASSWEGRTWARAGRREHGTQGGGGQTACRDGGDTEGTAGHHGHQARTRAGDRRLPQTARGRGKPVSLLLYTRQVVSAGLFLVSLLFQEPGYSLITHCKLQTHIYNNPITNYNKNLEVHKTTSNSVF